MNLTRQERLSGTRGDVKIGVDEVLRRDVEGASERYGCDGCTSQECEGLGGAVLVPFCIGKEEGGCDSALGGLLGSKVIPTDEDTAGGSGSDINATGFGKGIFRNDSREGRQDTINTASLGGRGRIHLGVNAICLSRRLCRFFVLGVGTASVSLKMKKAKHFKCGMCPRRLNTAGGLAVHVRQVHILEPEKCAVVTHCPGRDGYEVEIFGMEGIPAPDVADYKRRREIELGLAAGSISQPQPKRPKIDNRPLSEDELRAQLEARKALMGASSDAPAAAPAPEATSAVYNTAPTAYAVPPAPTPGITPLGASPPPGLPGISSPPFMPGFLPPGPFPGVPPMASPFPGIPGFPPGFYSCSYLILLSSSPPPGFPMPPPGLLPPPGMLPPGAPPFPPGVSRPPLPPPTFVPASSSSPVAPMNGTPASAPPTGSVPPAATALQPPAVSLSPPLVLPNPALEQKYGPFKKKTDLKKYADPNFSPEEKRGRSAKYYFASDATNTTPSQDQMASGTEEFRGKKRARAEDFL
ncbi:hypothetical protein BKA82DRAFT_19876 [Pisolithus tinctorius]|nr:hypothetical protein BKA82DRAFT_19876 [Pisolithus tinctorius]